MYLCKEMYELDIYRYNNEIDRWTKHFLYYFRKVSTVNDRITKYWFRFCYNRICKKHGIEIGRDVTIGKGFYIGHPYNITINSDAVLGNNINIHKGVTIGRENRGKRKGTPQIGDMVWIGINATIVGNIKIGNDVLIAPNTYVNCDIPDHSVVFGNPCQIRQVANATIDYINNAVG